MPDLIGSRSGRVLHFILSSHLQFGSTDFDLGALCISQDKHQPCNKPSVIQYSEGLFLAHVIDQNKLCSK